jgi:hypothetical protein
MKKENEKTFLQEILKDKEILTSRPPEMSYEEYKLLLKIQNKIIKRALK